MLVLSADGVFSAKYIEGLENRLGRMEKLLKLSGLLNAEDGHTDLGTLEKRLADEVLNNGHSDHRRSSTSDAQARSPEGSDTVSQNGTATDTRRHSVTEPPKDQEAAKGSSTTSSKPKNKDEEVEAVAELMCSLVTNNYGETRFIGKSRAPWLRLLLTRPRLIVRLFNILSQGDSMG